MKRTGVYILLCNNGRYYTGSTDDIDRRIAEHQRGKSKATKNLLPVEIKAFIERQDLVEARKLEYQIKQKKSRSYLETLITVHPWKG